MRLRFSLRLFLILFTVVAILCGGAAHFVYRVKEQAQRHTRACERLDQYGYAADEDEDWPDRSVPAWLVSFSRRWIDPKAYPAAMRVNFCNESLTAVEGKERLAIVSEFREVGALSIHPDVLDAEFVELLKRFKTLRHFDMSTRKLDVNAGAGLAELTALSHLTIEEPIEDASLAALAQLPNLKELTLDASQLTSQSIASARGFPKLRKLTLLGDLRDPGPLGAILQNESIEVLDLGVCRISANALAAIENAQSITELSVDGDEGNEELFGHIAKLGKLIKIQAYGLRPSQLQQIGALAACPDLSQMTLTGMKLKESDFGLLQPLTQLRLLSLEGSVSNEAIEAFLRAAPQCKVKVYSARDVWKEFSIVDGEMKVAQTKVVY